MKTGWWSERRACCFQGQMLSLHLSSLSEDFLIPSDLRSSPCCLPPGAPGTEGLQPHFWHVVLTHSTHSYPQAQKQRPIVILVCHIIHCCQFYGTVSFYTDSTFIHSYYFYNEPVHGTLSNFQLNKQVQKLCNY